MITDLSVSIKWNKAKIRMFGYWKLLNEKDFQDQWELML